MKDFEEFKGRVVYGIGSYLPEEYAGATVSIKTETKNNGLELTGLCVVKAGSVVSPIVYLEPFYQDYKNGVLMMDVLDEIAKLVVQANIEAFDPSNVKDFAKCRKRIIPCLINTGKNLDLLKKCPHKEVEDLSVIYKILVDVENNSGFVTIDNKFLNAWEISENELHAIAFRNAHETFECESMQSVIDGYRAATGTNNVYPPCAADSCMNIISNRSCTFGAAAVVDREFMSEVVARYGTDFFLLPSSIHEMLLITEGDVNTLRQMVREVNDTCVYPKDILSYNVYRYDPYKEKIKIIL